MYLHRLWSRLEDACAYMAAALIAAGMVLTVAEVLGRRLLNAPVPGVIDMVDLGMAAVALLGASQCQRVGGHVRMEMVLRRLKGRALWSVELMTSLAALFFVAVVAVASTGHAWRAYDFGDTTMDLLLPIWPSRVAVSFALFVLAGRLLLQVADTMRLVAVPSRTPVAALPPASVTDHAHEEIDEAFGHDDEDGRS